MILVKFISPDSIFDFKTGNTLNIINPRHPHQSQLTFSVQRGPQLPILYSPDQSPDKRSYPAPQTLVIRPKSGGV